MSCGASLQRRCRHAQKSAGLVGHSGMVELSVSLLAEPNSKLRTSVDAPHRPSWPPGRPYVDSQADSRVIQSVSAPCKQLILQACPGGVAGGPGFPIGDASCQGKGGQDV